MVWCIKELLPKAIVSFLSGSLIFITNSISVILQGRIIHDVCNLLLPDALKLIGNEKLH